MKSIESYYISYYKMDNNCRHINSSDNTQNNPYLCGKTCSLKYLPLMFTLKNYILNNIDTLRYIPICKKCINKLPKKLKKQVVYNLVVTKLKN